MSKVAILTNPDKLIEVKANFFADYFNFFAEYSGRFYETEPETVLSLVEKILLQINHNTNIHRTSYIAKHLNHSLFKDVSFLKLFASYSQIRPLMTDYLTNVGDITIKLEKKRSLWLRDHPQFSLVLSTFRDELKNKMFSEAVRQVIKMLTCKHSLAKHQKAIKKLTQILVSELIMRGRTKNDIINLFYRILYKSVNDFPFPKNVYATDDKKRYLLELDFEKQFASLVNYYDEDKKGGKIFLKVIGSFIRDTEEFSYAGIRFMSHSHGDFAQQLDQLSPEERSYGDRYFTGENYFIAEVHVESYSAINSESILKNLQFAINYLQLITAKKFLLDPTKFLIKYNDGKVAVHFGGGLDPFPFTTRDMENIRDNPFTILKKITGPAKDSLLKNEMSFINAIANQNVNELWSYLEHIFSKTPENLINDLANILLINEKDYRRHLLVSALRNSAVPWDFNYHGIGIEPGLYVSLYNQLNKKKYSEFIRMLKYPLFDEIGRLLAIRHSRNRYVSLHRYYTSNLWELYENRNFHTHQNVVHFLAHQKIFEVSPDLIRRFRWVLFDYIKRRPKLTMGQIIQSAGQQGAALLSN